MRWQKLTLLLCFFRSSTTTTPALTENIPSCWKGARGESPSNAEPSTHRRWMKDAPPAAPVLRLRGTRGRPHPPSDGLKQLPAPAAPVHLQRQLLPRSRGPSEQPAGRGSPRWPSASCHRPAPKPRVASRLLLRLLHRLQGPRWEQPQLCWGQGHPTAPPAPADAPVLRSEPSTAHPGEGRVPGCQ